MGPPVHGFCHPRNTNCQGFPGGQIGTRTGSDFQQVAGHEDGMKYTSLKRTAKAPGNRPKPKKGLSSNNQFSGASCLFQGGYYFVEGIDDT